MSEEDPRTQLSTPQWAANFIPLSNFNGFLPFLKGECGLVD